ncbi:MAG: radical SAM protein [Patescibacteria group bacterium]|nr:radical SAM protein [Patescibacteria group bacterium]
MISTKQVLSDREAPVRKVVVVLIKPTHYDDDGFPYRFARGVLPSSSMGTMYALTRQALCQVVPTNTAFEIHLFEDGIGKQAKRLARLYRRFPEAGTQLIVGLVSVQTPQFPRACDLAARWQARGATCVIGGFHVSGSIATMLDGIADPHRPDIPCPHQMPADLQALISRGVIVFHGEAEDQWSNVLKDILRGSPQPLYRGGLPDLRHSPLPEFPPVYCDRSFSTKMQAVDTGRGCLFGCSFCTIINVQGRNPRFRDPAAVVAYVVEQIRRDPQVSFFFTDDNFARNPAWERILDGLIAARCGARFMVQADLACGKIPRFLDKLAAAGCIEMFNGVESMNPANLAAAGKRQNCVADYAALWRRCHALGIVVHASYIIGFPYDTPASVARDVEQLAAAGADKVSFYILTLAPGSEDHARALAAGQVPVCDGNRLDSFHAVGVHPRMTPAEWQSAYLSAWRQFYCVKHMVAALKRHSSRRLRLTLLFHHLWNRWSVFTERTHPMIAGFYRIRSYRDRRPGATPLPFWRFVLQEVWRHLRYVGRGFAEFYRFQQVALEGDCFKTSAERQAELAGQLRGIRDWFHRTFGRGMTRRWLNNFWLAYGRNRWRLLFDPRTYYRWHLKIPPYAIAELVYTIRFGLMLVRLRKVIRT